MGLRLGQNTDVQVALQLDCRPAPDVTLPVMHGCWLVLQVEQRLQAKELEVQELMGMCDQLLQQREAQTAVTAP